MSSASRSNRRCFLSHNYRDKVIAEDVGQQLLQHGIDVWFDKWEVYAGDSLEQTISEGLRQSDVFIIFLSKHSVNAPWVKDELRIALDKRRRDPEFLLIPVMIEKCEIPEFLRDAVFVDWNNQDTDPFAEVLRSIKRVSFKPELTEKTLCKIEHLDVRQTLKFFGPRGTSVRVVEKFRSKAAGDITSIDRAVNYGGVLDSLECTGFTVKRHQINPSYEKWTLVPQTEISAGEVFSYEISYTLNDCFPADEEFWFYAIEALTDQVCLEFNYEEVGDLPKIEVKRRQGQTTYPESQGMLKTGMAHRWNKKFPVQNNTYEFLIKWPDSESVA